MARISAWIAAIERTVVAYGIILIALMTVVNVFFRTVVQSSLTFAEEANQILIILVTFFGLSYAARRARHIRMSALYDQLSERWRKIFMIGISAFTSALLFFLCWHAVAYVQHVKELGTLTPALGIPVWLVYLPAPAGLFLAGLQYLGTTLRNITRKDVHLSFDVTEQEHEGERGEAPVE